MDPLLRTDVLTEIEESEMNPNLVGHERGQLDVTRSQESKVKQRHDRITERNEWSTTDSRFESPFSEYVNKRSIRDLARLKH